MKSTTVHIGLQTTPEQRLRLQALQAMFAQACNALVPLVQETRCWNRVALHHMAYKRLREQFPDLGSQMVCNTIYSVSRISRIVFQHPASPFHVARLADKPLPRIHFAAHAPVYFDRHTLSLKAGVVSMFTLDGRMRFQLNLQPANERRFRDAKLREIVLSGTGEQYRLSFVFGADEAAVPARQPTTDWPEYVLVTDQDTALPQPLSAWLQAAPALPGKSPLPRHPQAAASRPILATENPS